MKLALGYFQRMAIAVILILLPGLAFSQIVENDCLDGTLSAGQSICPGTQPTDLILTANTGAIIKWQSSLSPDFSTPTDIDVSSAVLSGDIIGAVVVPTYFRAVIQSSTCSFAASGYTLVSINTVAPHPGSVSRFTLFTAIGAVSNTGITTIQGDIGTNSGDIMGFESPSFINGLSHRTNAITEQATDDVNALYAMLQSTPATNSVHVPFFGNGEILTSGVYVVQEAISVTGNIVLDAQGDSDKILFSGLWERLQQGPELQLH